MDSFIQYFRRIHISSRYFTLHRTTNWCKLALSYLYSYTGIQIHFNCSPNFISVEATNFCNLQCPECPTGKKQLSSSDCSVMDIILYKQVIDELKVSLMHVIFYFQGEPFLHTQLNELIQYAHEARLHTSTSTNAQFLTNERAKEIVESGLDKLIVSIDGCTQEVYETYRVGGNLQKAIEGIERIVAWKKALKSATPLVVIQFLVLKTNEHQMKDMKQLAKTLRADRLTFKTAQLSDFVNGNSLLPTQNRYARYKKGKDGKFHVKGNQPNRCWRLWSGAVVNVHGEVLPCCFDKASEFSFGNIQESSFPACWHSSKSSDFRDKILQNRMQFDMCRNCTSH